MSKTYIHMIHFYSAIFFGMNIQLYQLLFKSMGHDWTTFVYSLEVYSVLQCLLGCLFETSFVCVCVFHFAKCSQQSQIGFCWTSILCEVLDPDSLSSREADERTPIPKENCLPLLLPFKCYSFLGQFLDFCQATPLNNCLCACHNTNFTILQEGFGSFRTTVSYVGQPCMGAVLPWCHKLYIYLSIIYI